MTNNLSDHTKQKRKVLYIIILSACLLFFVSICKSLWIPISANIEKDSSSSFQQTTSGTLKKEKVEDTIMTYIYNAPESQNDSRYEYQWEILKTALEKTKTKYGPYMMVKSKFMTEKRQLFELENEARELTVMYLGTTREFEKNLRPIHIPVDKNLGGYCVMLIRREDQEKLNRVKTLNDFRKLSVGLGYGWIDVGILRSNHFNVVTGSNYEGLFKMLFNKRFDVFSRSAVEILDEYEARKTELKGLKIEDSLLLYYPLPMYFWFSKKETGKKLAKRAEEGMKMMINDGSYDKLFLKYHGYKTEALHLKKRRMFKIENPFLVPETPFADKRLWYNPIHP